MRDVEVYVSTQRSALKIHLSIADSKVCYHVICTNAMVDNIALSAGYWRKETNQAKHLGQFQSAFRRR